MNEVDTPPVIHPSRSLVGDSLARHQAFSSPPRQPQVLLAVEAEHPLVIDLLAFSLQQGV